MKFKHVVHVALPLFFFIFSVIYLQIIFLWKGPFICSLGSICRFLMAFSWSKSSLWKDNLYTSTSLWQHAGFTAAGVGGILKFVVWSKKIYLLRPNQLAHNASRSCTCMHLIFWFCLFTEWFYYPIFGWKLFLWHMKPMAVALRDICVGVHLTAPARWHLAALKFK